jgi:glycosyltransferase involved in cell wall biosynthesis
VSVVIPFAGDARAARSTIGALSALVIGPGDELILADNSGVLAADAAAIRIIRAAGERSPAHARNVGAAQAGGEWILFLDADVVAPPDLIDAFFSAPVAGDVGALAGEVVPVPPAARTSLAERYAAARNFLGQQAHLAHPYLPRAAAANLLVRRAAFEQLGGFVEGVRAAEDTDFCWRLQQAGWRLELCDGATVQHRYRATLGELRSQWRGYAAGRAWLARRYPDFHPEPALARAIRGRGRRSTAIATATATATAAAAPTATARGRGPLPFVALDALLAVDELIGFRMSNEIRRSPS